MKLYTVFTIAECVCVSCSTVGLRADVDVATVLALPVFENENFPAWYRLRRLNGREFGAFQGFRFRIHFLAWIFSTLLVLCVLSNMLNSLLSLRYILKIYKSLYTYHTHYLKKNCNFFNQILYKKFKPICKIFFIPYHNLIL